MAVTAFMYGLALKSAFNKEIDIDSDTLKVILTTSAYTPNQDTHQYLSSVTNEVTGTGYTAGGATLASVTSNYTGASNLWWPDADNTVWSTSTITARRAVVYDSTPASDATRPLLLWLDFGEDMISSGGNFTIAWDAAGFAGITVA